MTFIPTYTKVSAYPALPTSSAATIYFHGLICMCFNDNQRCTAAANHVSMPHHPKFGIFQRGTPCHPILELNPQPTQEIEVRAVNSSGKSKDNVSVYSPTTMSPPPPPDRFSFTT